MPRGGNSTARLTQEEFLERCREVHNNYYDYSLANFTSTRVAIDIICPKHGKFSQQAKNHLHDHGCPQCGRKSQGEAIAIDTAEFLKRAQEKHGDRYSYPNLNVKRSGDIIKIICKDHGEFEQKARLHYEGGGCKKCAIENLKVTFSEFLEKANEVHNGKFNHPDGDFFDTDYIRVECPKHGIFTQIRNYHLIGHDCKKCYNEKVIEKSTITKEEFLKKSKEVHGDRFDYSKVFYKDHKEEVIIICKQHGEFLQRPRYHMDGKSCYKCHTDNSRINIDDFLKTSKKVHNNKFDYSKVNFTDRYDYVEIICPTHGSFSQAALKHMYGSGCKKCAVDEQRVTKEEFIERANIAHKNKYDYSKVDWKGHNQKVEIVCPDHGSFWQKPEKHSRSENPNGCKKCSSFISKKENDWLDIVGVPDDPEHRQVSLAIGDRKIIVDGYQGATNTVYEFHGDYWHGNPTRFDPEKLNKNSERTFGELYKNTIDRESIIKEAGFNLVTIWESDFDILVDKKEENE